MLQRREIELDDFDEAAAAAAFGEDPDAALRLLTRIAQLTPSTQSDLAFRLANQVIVELARGDQGLRSGIQTLRPGPVESGGDLDLDASLPAIALSRKLGTPIRRDDLRTRVWARQDHALTLLIDHSGSMDGDRLAAAAVAAAVLAIRSPRDYSVIAFAGDAIVIKAQREERPLAAVVDDILALRGYGTTNVSLGLRAGLAQLARSNSARRIGVALTDGVATTGPDPRLFASRYDQLHVICPDDSSGEAAVLARCGSGSCARLSRPTEIGRALAELMR